MDRRLKLSTTSNLFFFTCFRW